MTTPGPPADLSQPDFLGRGWAFPVGVPVDGDGRIAMADSDDSIRQSIRTILSTTPTRLPPLRTSLPSTSDAAFGTSTLTWYVGTNGRPEFAL